jgi:hypothetical protein
MKRSSLLFSIVLFSAFAASSAQAAEKFEAVTLEGTPKSNPALFEINVATGKVMSVWSSSATAQIPVQDSAALPAGEYHLFVSINAAADGSNYIWMVNRMDANSGRVWSLTGGGTAPLTWTEVVPPK